MKKITKITIALLLTIMTGLTQAQSFVSDVIITLGVPSVNFVDTTDAQEWQAGIGPDTTTFSIKDESNILLPFQIEENAPNNALYVENSGQVGFGTSNPQQSLHVVSGLSQLRLENDSSSGLTPQIWDLGNQGHFILFDVTTGTAPLNIQNGAPTSSLKIDDLGRVGLGTIAPEAALHIKAEEDAVLKTRVMIESTNTGKAVRKLLHLKNKGAARLEFENTDSGVKWILNPNAIDNFMITRIGSPGPDFVVKQNGDAAVRRNLTCKQVLQTSARASKENFEPINKHDILEKLADLEVEGWNYKTDPAQRHIGPMAEDFNKAFPGANSDKYINVGDATGALIASVQSLKEKNDAQAKLIDTLVERLSALETKLK